MVTWPACSAISSPQDARVTYPLLRWVPQAIESKSGVSLSRQAPNCKHQCHHSPARGIFSPVFLTLSLTSSPKFISKIEDEVRRPKRVQRTSDVVSSTRDTRGSVRRARFRSAFTVRAFGVFGVFGAPEHGARPEAHECHSSLYHVPVGSRSARHGSGMGRMGHGTRQAVAHYHVAHTLCVCTGCTSRPPQLTEH